jgi:hypothetical protein
MFFDGNVIENSWDLHGISWEFMECSLDFHGTVMENALGCSWDFMELSGTCHGICMEISLKCHGMLTGFHGI